MRIGKRIGRLAGGALLLALVGCEDSQVLAPGDGKIVLTASPSTVVIVAGQTSGTSTISAQVFDKDNFDLEGVDVTFTTSAGTLALPGQAPVNPLPSVETDSDGIARVTLSIAQGDAAPVTVTARSGALSETVQVSRGTGNRPPLADLNLTPAGGQRKGRPVNFDGTGSDDPDGDAITCYRWEIDSSVNASDEIVQDAASASFTRSFPSEQTLQVTLRVTDDVSAAGAACPTAPLAVFSSQVASADYDIVCDLNEPIAAAGPDVSANLAGNPTVMLTFDGGNSSDPDSGDTITGFSWNCGNGTAPQNNAVASCTYDHSAVYTVRLTVTNACGLTSFDEARVTIGQ
ncbi:MAG TPA: PKD domain-containing protein [Candidatus Polarisedimenticolaceae bacterium]|nr:PKD domain-containing protein [Candidatus Polarisedimenticolaceae bacterium]